jgi:hypothetical protein
MGQNLSQIVKDPRKGRELQRIYDTSLALMIVNLIVAFLPQTGLGWIPFFGGWVQLLFVLMSMTFSIIIYRMSNSFLPEYYGRGVNRAHLWIYILVVLLTIGGAISQSASQAKYDRCMSKAREDYYNRYSTPTCYTPTNYVYTTVGTMPTYVPVAQPEICSISTPSYGYYDGYYSCYGLMFDTPSIIMNNIMVPILSFVAMVLFSIQCSFLWNESNGQARKLAGQIQMMPVTMQTVTVTTPTGQHQVTVPVTTYNAFAQYGATQGLEQQTLPAYAPPMQPPVPVPATSVYGVPVQVPVASSSANPPLTETPSQKY